MMELKRLDPRRVDWVGLRKAPQKLAALLLVIAIFFTGIAWQVQAAAARALVQARELQERDTNDQGSPPPSTAENRQVLEVLDDSIQIRKEIDDMLGLVEDGVAGLRESQTESQAIAVSGRRQLRAIAGALGGSIGATRSSVTRLRRLDSSLGTSVTLARLIAEELEELDRKLGPTVGRGR
jgi:hypothetical protein